MWPFSNQSRDSRKLIGTLEAQLAEQRKANAWWKTWVPIVLTMGGLGVSVAALVVTLGLREDVQSITSQDPQEMVDQLVIGRTQEQVEQVLGVLPTVSDQRATPWASIPELSYRMYEALGGDLLVEVLFDELGQARLYEITAKEQSMHLRHPPSAQTPLDRFVTPNRQTGEYESFETHRTTLGQVYDGCPGFDFKVAIAASFAWASGYCPPLGANNFTEGMVGISLFAENDGLGATNNDDTNYDLTVTFTTFVYLDNKFFPGIGKLADTLEFGIQEWLEVGPNRFDPPSQLCQSVDPDNC